MNHCGEKTRALGHDSCTDYVRAEPSAFHETYWAVRSLDVYHKALERISTLEVWYWLGDSRISFHRDAVFERGLVEGLSEMFC